MDSPGFQVGRGFHEISCFEVWFVSDLLPVGLCTKKASRALIERPYSHTPQAVGAVYDRPGVFVQRPVGEGEGYCVDELAAIDSN